MREMTALPRSGRRSPSRKTAKEKYDGVPSGPSTRTKRALRKLRDMRILTGRQRTEVDVG